MRKRTIIYVAGYALKKNTGRNKATHEKADALRAVVGTSHFRFWHPVSSGIALIDYVLLALFDLRMLVRAMFLSRGAIVIQRQTVLLLTNTLLRFRGIPIFCEVHADAQDELRLLDKRPLEKVLLRTLLWSERYNLRLAAGIICNHPQLQAVMQERYHKPSVYVYNGANTTDFVIRDATDCRRRLRLNPSGKYFLFLGMISKWHGVEQLVRIFKQQEMQGFTLLLVGAVDNQYVEGLRNDARGLANIVFIDHTNVAKSADYINASDVCLLPVNNLRTSPGSPLKLYDYVACGKPVVAQAGVMGYSDEVERWALGGVVDFKDPAHAGAFLAAFIGHADMDFYAVNNRRVAEENVSWKQRMEEWMRFVEGIKGS